MNSTFTCSIFLACELFAKQSSTRFSIANDLCKKERKHQFNRLIGCAWEQFAELKTKANMSVHNKAISFDFIHKITLKNEEH